MSYSIDDLNVPPPLPRLPAGAGANGGGVSHRGVVLDARPDSAGMIRVLIHGTAYHVRLRSTAKAVRTGDNVDVQWVGHVPHVVGSDTWHEPPSVSAPPSGTVPAASTVSGSNISQVPIPPDPPSSNVGSTLEWVIVWAENVRSYLFSFNTWTMLHRSRTDQLIEQVNDLRSAVNTNASRLNSTRDVATGTRNSVTGMRSALGDEGIVR